jgi:Tfp pilus assembly protein PilZ
MEADSRRRALRTSCGLAVRFGIESLEFAGIAENISEVGLFVNTERVFRVGTRLLLRIEFPDRAILQHGTVAWALEPVAAPQPAQVHGMGISFTHADREWLSIFRAWRAALAP